MKFILFSSLLSFILNSSFAGINMRENLDVTNLGSLHSYMLEKQNYNLNDFISAIKQYKPEIILTETRKEFPGPLEGSIDGGIEQSIVYAIAEEINADVIAVDSWDENYFRDWKNESKDMENNSHFMELFLPIYKQREENIAKLSLVELNDEKQEIVRKQYQLFKEFSYITSDIRNANICKNIKDALANSEGNKVMSIFGLDHKYYLDDCITSLGLNLINVNSWYKEKLLYPKSETKVKIIKNIQDSKLLLSDRISGGYYSPMMSKHLSNKLPKFDAWISKAKEILAE